MPTYQYQCRNCGAGLEKFQPFSAEPLVECPTCGQPALKRVMQPAGIIFKGSGWYITDSKKSTSATTPAGSTSNGESDGEKTETKSTEPASTASDAKSTESKPAESKNADSKNAESKAALPAPASSG